MAITFSLSAASGTNIISQSDIGANKSLTLNISSLEDTENNSAAIADYTYDWYFIDKPNNTNISLDTTVTANNQSVILNSIDVWGTYRLFVIAKQTNNVSNKSEENPLKAIEEHFINIVIKSTNNDLEKPANFQRNWRDQYNKLVEVVDSTTKNINKIKTSSSTTFTFPSSNGVNGQILKTDGTGNLTFTSIDLSSLETNISLDGLSDVDASSPNVDDIIKWDGNSWITSELPAISSIDGLTSVNNELIVSNNYSLVPESDDSIDLGTMLNNFSNLYVYNISSLGTVTLGDPLYTLPSGDGSEGQVLKTDGSGTTSFGSIDEIAKLNTTIKLTDTSSNDSKIAFKTNNVIRWNIDNNGDIMPESDNSYTIGKYVGYMSPDNKLIENIGTKKITIDGFEISTSGTTTADLDILIKDQYSSNLNIPFYDNTESNSASGHLLIKDIVNENSNTSWNVWGAKFPSVSDGEANDILALDSNSNLAWKKALGTWSGMHSAEWAISQVSLPSINTTYSTQLGSSICIFAFKNNSGSEIKTIDISLSCLEMHSSSIDWSISTGSDATVVTQGFTNKSSAVSTMTRQNTSGNNVGIGISNISDSNISVSNNDWLLIILNDNVSGAADDKRFFINITYEIN